MQIRGMPGRAAVRDRRASADQRPSQKGPMMTSFTLNGKSQTIDADPEMPLLWVIRDLAGLTGTKFGCGQALCGACTVMIDGVPGRSCQTSLSSVEGLSVTTIEGMTGRVTEVVQQVWTALDVPQCGYCQSGQVIAAVDLLTNNKAPTDADIDDALSGNLCRCNTYHRIRGAIHDAAKLLEA
jgi:isoquinoline 1-oxidoreductase subunit alpha